MYYKYFQKQDALVTPPLKKEGLAFVNIKKRMNYGFLSELKYVLSNYEFRPLYKKKRYLLQTI